MKRGQIDDNNGTQERKHEDTMIKFGSKTAEQKKWGKKERKKCWREGKAQYTRAMRAG